MIIKFNIAVPNWRWVHRLIERLHPGFFWRAERWGRTSETASFLGKGVEITTTAVAERSCRCGLTDGGRCPVCMSVAR